MQIHLSLFCYIATPQVAIATIFFLTFLNVVWISAESDKHNFGCKILTSTLET